MTGLSLSSHLAPADVFDEEWYRRRYPDVQADDAFAHFVTRGWREGRDPHPAFDTDWYLAAYPGTVESGTDPLTHFLDHGRQRSFRPNPLFDPDGYRRAHLRDSDEEPFAHFLRAGMADGLPPGPAVADVVAWTAATAPSQVRSVTAVVASGEDAVHAERCVRALLQAEGPRGIAVGSAEPPRLATVVAESATLVEVILVVRGSEDHVPALRRLESLPGVRFATDLPEQVAGDYVVLLHPDAEPATAFLADLVAQVEAEASRTGTGRERRLVVAPRARASLVAPGVPSDWPPLARLALPPQAVLVEGSHWPDVRIALGDSSEDEWIRAVTEWAATTLVADDTWILSHRPMSLALKSKREIEYLDAEASAGPLLLAASVDRPVATAALMSWLQAASCHMDGAQRWLDRWRDLRSQLPRDEQEALPRLFRRQDQLIADVVHECSLQAEVTRRAAAALRTGSVDAAVENLADAPDSYAASVAAVTLLSRDWPAERGDSVIPRVVVQGWFDSAMPGEVGELARGWRDHHRDGGHVLVDSDSAAEWIRERLGPEQERVFRSASPVGKSNLFRYAYLADSGGVWSDIDDRCLDTVWPVIEGYGLVIVRETIGAIADNFIAAVPGHPALLATRDEAFRNVRDGFVESPWLANGPGVFTRKVAAWLAGMLPGPASPTLVLRGWQASAFVSMHQPLSYKETELAWDVRPDAAGQSADAAEPRSLRQRSLRASAAPEGR